MYYLYNGCFKMNMKKTSIHNDVLKLIGGVNRNKEGYQPLINTEIDLHDYYSQNL